MHCRAAAVITFFAVTAFAEGPPPVKAPPAKPATGPLFVGVVASLNDEVAKQQADALALWASGALKQPVQARVFADQESLAQAVGKAQVDLALMGPLAWFRIDGKAKVNLVFRTVRNGRATYRAVLFAGPKSKLKDLVTLKQAKNLKVAWVETSSATGYVIPKGQLLVAGVDPAQLFETQDFLGTHEAVCTAVWEGKYDVGATFSDPSEKGLKLSGCEGPLGKRAVALKPLVVSEEIPNDVLVAAPGVSAEQLAALRATGKLDATTPEGRKALGQAFLAEGVADVTEADLVPVRKALEAFSR